MDCPCPYPQALDEQLAAVANERANLVRMRTELEKAANRLEQERQAWERTRVGGWGGRAYRTQAGSCKLTARVVRHHQLTVRSAAMIRLVAPQLRRNLRGWMCVHAAVQAEEQSRWDAQREAEEAKLRRDRRVLEKQGKALLKLPNKKERTAMEGRPRTCS